MRRHHRREGPGLTPRPVQIAAQVEAGPGLEQHLLDRIPVAVEFAEDLRADRRLLRQRQQASARQDLLSQECGAFQPRLAAGEDRHREMRICIAEIGVARVLIRDLSRRERPGTAPA